MKTTIDGEFSRISTMLSRDWTNKLVKNLQKAETDGVGSLKHDTILVVGNNFGRAFSGFVVEGKKPAGKTLLSPAMQDPRMGYRPVLKFNDWEIFSVNNPDGSVAQGGTIYLDDVPIDPTHPIAYPFIPLRAPGNVPVSTPAHLPNIRIGDTEPGFALHWVWHNGFLVCTSTPIFNLSVDLIRTLDLYELS